MRKISLVLSFLGGASFYLHAQQPELENQVLFTVEDDTVTAGEYMAVYNKNRSLGEDIDPKTPLEYLDLYKNFKLKVHHAKKLGMDTMPSFIKEYTTYRNQLAKPYLSDRAVTEELVHQAYDRMKKDVRVAHILMGLREGANELEVEKARQKMEKLRERILAGEDFAKLAEEYSTDTYSAQRGGDLGYFTAFNMIYPFETVSYELEKGEISEPFQTQFGWHLVKKLDERPARGEISVSHIMVIDNEESSTADRVDAENKIREIYAELEKGAKFGEMARLYSDDKSSARSGGNLPAFGINRMYPDFEEQAFALQNPGDYSEPFKTEIGWHIVKLDEKTGIPEFSKMEKEIKNKVERDSRSQQSHESIIRRLKREYNFREYPRLKNEVFDKVGEKFINREFDKNSLLNQSKVLFEFGNEKYSVEDFGDFLQQAQMRQSNKVNWRLALEKAYDEFSEAKLVAYEKERLEKKYPEFRLLAKEYYEGILLFNLTEEKVWRKSVSDSIGLLNFYEANKQNYKWKTRYDVVMVNADSKKTAKKARKMLSKGKTVEEVKQSLNKESNLLMSTEMGVFEENAAELVNYPNLKLGFSDITESGERYHFIQVREIMPATEKKMDETRGMLISDYQNYLEKQWLDFLKKEYEVEVNEPVLNSVISTLESGSN